MLSKFQSVAMLCILFFALCVDGIAEKYGLRGVVSIGGVVLLIGAVALLISDRMERARRWTK